MLKQSKALYKYFHLLFIFYIEAFIFIFLYSYWNFYQEFLLDPFFFQNYLEVFNILKNNYLLYTSFKSLSILISNIYSLSLAGILLIYVSDLHKRFNIIHIKRSIIYLGVFIFVIKALLLSYVDLNALYNKNKTSIFRTYWVNILELEDSQGKNYTNQPLNLALYSDIYFYQEMFRLVFSKTKKDKIDKILMQLYNSYILSVLSRYNQEKFFHTQTSPYQYTNIQDYFNTLLSQKDYVKANYIARLALNLGLTNLKDKRFVQKIYNDTWLYLHQDNRKNSINQIQLDEFYLIQAYDKISSDIYYEIINMLILLPDLLKKNSTQYILNLLIQDIQEKGFFIDLIRYFKSNEIDTLNNFLFRNSSSEQYTEYISIGQIIPIKEKYYFSDIDLIRINKITQEINFHVHAPYGMLKTNYISLNSFNSTQYDPKLGWKILRNEYPDLFFNGNIHLENFVNFDLLLQSKNPSNSILSVLLLPTILKSFSHMGFSYRFILINLAQRVLNFLIFLILLSIIFNLPIYSPLKVKNIYWFTVTHIIFYPLFVILFIFPTQWITQLHESILNIASFLSFNIYFFSSLLGVIYLSIFFWNARKLN